MNKAIKSAIVLSSVVLLSVPAFAGNTAADGLKEKAKAAATEQTKSDSKTKVMDKAKEKGMEKGKEAAGKMLKK